MIGSKMKGNEKEGEMYETFNGSSSHRSTRDRDLNPSFFLTTAKKCDGS